MPRSCHYSIVASESALRFIVSNNQTVVLLLSNEPAASPNPNHALNECVRYFIIINIFININIIIIVISSSSSSSSSNHSNCMLHSWLTTKIRRVAWSEKLHVFKISAANCDEYISFALRPL
jgi:hypothetical protein